MNIGLVYSGGISKCAYQIGFTQALLNFIPYEDIKVVSGSSMGLFTAYALSSGKLPQLQSIYESIDISSTFSLYKQVWFKKLLSRAMKSFFTPTDNLQIPVCIPVSYFPIFSTKYHWIYKQYNPYWKDYIRAASCFPFLCGWPKILERRLTIDGGAVDNIPLYPLLKMQHEFLPRKENLDLIIVLHFNARYDYRKEFKTDIPVLDIDVAACNHFKKRHFDFSKEYVDEMLEKSREYGMQIGEKLFTKNDNKTLQERIDEIFLQEHAERQSHQSLDGLLTIVNAIGKFFRNNSKCNKRLY